MKNIEVNRSSLVKAILFRSLLPQVFYVMVLVIIHWAIASFWISLNFEIATKQKLTLVGLLTGIVPVITYGLWGVRRFLNKGYIIFHNRVVKYWIQDFSQSLARKIVKDNYLKQLEAEQSSILNQLRIQLLQKIKLFPKIIQRLFKFLLNKIGINNDLDKQIKLVKEGNVKEISTFLSQKISELVLRANDNLFPVWVSYLIPINTFLFVVLWFL